MPAPVQQPSGMGRLRAGGSLRRRVARGTLVNAGFQIGLNGLGLLKNLVVAGLISTGDFGIYAIVLLAVGAFVALKQAGAGQKFVQQDEPDQEAAFQKAFTLELIYSGVLLAVFVTAVPLLGLAYGRTDIVAPGLVLALVVPALALQLPVQIFYRDMDFLRQRTLQAADPIVGFVVSVALAVAGFGEWALVIGLVAGTWVGALVIVRACPHPLRLRYERGTIAEYVGFSWPLLIAALSGIVIGQASVFAAEAALGIQAVGAILLAASFATYGQKVDAIVSDTLYPVICAARDHTALLFETFVKSNRLALMVSVPVGVGLFLFAPDLVHLVLGDRWQPAVLLMQVFGLTTAVDQIGFNWSAFYRARGDTRPIAVLSVVTAVVSLTVAVPLLIFEGLPGFAVGTAAMSAVALVVRTVYLTRLFAAFALVPYIVRVLVAPAGAGGLILAWRTVHAAERTPAQALIELVAFVALTAISTAVLERALLREVLGYLAGRPPALLGATAGPTGAA